MKQLLCRIGIHTPAWHATTPDSTQQAGWLQLRRCTHCLALLAR